MSRLSSALLLAAALPLGGRADEPRPPAEGVTPLRVAVGETVDLCRTGLRCPALAPICDDATLVSFDLGPAGLRLRGVKPGETICSVRDSGGQGMRRVYRVTVAAPAP